MYSVIQMKTTFLLITLFLFGSAEQADSQWVYVSAPVAGSLEAVAISGKNLLAGSIDGIYVSSDNGSNWIKTFDKPYSNVSLFTVSDTNTFAGYYQGGVIISTNNGISWNQCGLIGLTVNTL